MAWASSFDSFFKPRDASSPRGIRHAASRSPTSPRLNATSTDSTGVTIGQRDETIEYGVMLSGLHKLSVIKEESMDGEKIPNLVSFEEEEIRSEEPQESVTFDYIEFEFGERFFDPVLSRKFLANTVITIENREVFVNREFLSKSSEVFAEHFSKRHQEFIISSNVSAEDFVLFLDYLHHPTKPIVEGNVATLLEQAETWRSEIITMRCENYLAEAKPIWSPELMIEHFQLADKHGFESIRKELLDLMDADTLGMLLEDQQFRVMNLKAIQDVIAKAGKILRSCAKSHCHL